MDSRVGQSVRDKVIAVFITAGIALWSVASPPADAIASEIGQAATPPRNPLPQVVAAVLDTGINPYHEQFRDHSPLAHVHPSTYLRGFPRDAEAIHLTLDASTYEDAVKADSAEWEKVEIGKLYWIPGTRIAGAITFTDLCPDPCKRFKHPWRILDRQEHGTMTASRLAGESTSLCPECRIVAVQLFDFDVVDAYADELFMPKLAAASLWAARQPWIDIQSNSWGHLPHSYPFVADERAKIREAAALQPTFFAGGNGVYATFGVAGHPAWLDNAAGPDGVITVGAHDNGKPTLWSATLPHVVADGLAAPALHHESLDEMRWRGAGGTSGSTPFAAGGFAAMILEARRSLGDRGTGVRGGDIVVAAPGARLPSQGPLHDGRLDQGEAKRVYLHTANPRPAEEPKWDGEQYNQVCSPNGRFFSETQRFNGKVFCTIYLTAPLEFKAFPSGVPAYYFVGYGQVGQSTIEVAGEVLLGKTPLPNRPQEDMFFKADSDVRSGFDEAAAAMQSISNPLPDSLD